MPTKPKARPSKPQRTAQIFLFATKLRDEITSALKENPTVVTSAAVLAFSKLPVEQQLDHIAAVRRQHATA